MLDENLPTFFIKPPSTDNPFSNLILLREDGSELQPKYAFHRPNPKTQDVMDCYAIALYDSYNTDILYAEVLVRPEWTQSTLNTAETHSQNLVPTVPSSFTIQLYNPDQQIVVKQIAGKWNASTHWEFQMPQNSFKVPSGSAIDQIQNAPAAWESTQMVKFKWKRDGKLSRDISCYMVTKSIEAKKSKEPDIAVGLFKSGKRLTIYQPNMHRVDVEDFKGLEVILLLSGVVIKDIFFNPTKEMFNIDSTSGSKGRNASLEISGSQNYVSALRRRSISTSTDASITSQPTDLNPHQTRTSKNSTSQQEIDAETERLQRIVEAEEKAIEDAEKEEQHRILEMLEAEELELRRRHEEEVRAEELRRQYAAHNLQTPSNTNIHPAPAPATNIQNQQHKSNYLYTLASNTLIGGGTKLLSSVQKVQKKKSTYF